MPHAIHPISRERLVGKTIRDAEVVTENSADGSVTSYVVLHLDGMRLWASDPELYSDEPLDFSDPLDADTIAEAIGRAIELLDLLALLAHDRYAALLKRG